MRQELHKKALTARIKAADGNVAVFALYVVPSAFDDIFWVIHHDVLLNDRVFGFCAVKKCGFRPKRADG